MWINKLNINPPHVNNLFFKCWHLINRLFTDPPYCRAKYSVYIVKGLMSGGEKGILESMCDHKTQNTFTL